MNIYDFDKTIYNGDSTIDFYLFCLKKKPRIIRFIFKQGFAVFLHKLHKIDTTSMKEIFFVFLKDFKEIDSVIEEFWNINRIKIKNFYLNQKNSIDIIISASPEFLLKPICEDLDVTLIGTIVNKETGKISGKNCKGIEKIKRLKEKFPNVVIDKFYSDSKSDQPLAEIAKEAYLVIGNTVTIWKN